MLPYLLMPIWLSILLGALSLIAAAASAIAAWKSYGVSRANHEWRQSIAGPRVRVTVRKHKDVPQFIVIVIENCGGSTAFDINFTLSRVLPATAFAMSPDETMKSPVRDMDSGPLITGIPALASGDSRTVLWGAYSGLHHSLGDSFVTVTARYIDESKNKFETLSVLEVRSFFGNDASENTPLSKIRKELSEIERAIRSLGDYRPLTVETPAMREIRMQKEIERLNSESGTNA